MKASVIGSFNFGTGENLWTIVGPVSADDATLAPVGRASGGTPPPRLIRKVGGWTRGIWLG